MRSVYSERITVIKRNFSMVVGLFIATFICITGILNAGTITYESIADVASSGITNTIVYTHAIDFGGWSQATINGVTFGFGNSGGIFPSTNGTSQTVGTGNSTVPTSHGGNNPFPGNPLNPLFEDMTYDNNNAVITLTGLTPGQEYRFRLYHRAWTDSTRNATIFFDDVEGDVFPGTPDGAFNEDDATDPDPSFSGGYGQAYALVFTYTLPAGVGDLRVNIKTVGGSSYHLYGLSNEETTAGTYLSFSDMGISNLTSISGDVFATIANTDADEVVLVWDTSDKLTGSTNDWTDSKSLGAQNVGDVTTDVTGLTADTAYNFRFWATNSTHAIDGWSANMYMCGPVWLEGAQTNATQVPMTPGTVTVCRASTATNEKTEVYFTISGVAVEGTDYEITDSPVTIAKGASNVTIVVTPLLNHATTTKTVIVTLDAEHLYTVGTPGSMTVEIVPRSSFPTPVSEFMEENILVLGNSGIVRYSITGDWSSWSATKLSNVYTNLASDINGPTSMAMSPDGKYLAIANYGSTNVLRYRYNQETGTATPAGNLANGGDGAILSTDPAWGEVWYVVYSSDGKLYATVNDGGNANGKVYQINNSGIATPFAAEPENDRVGGLVFGPDLTGDGIADLFVSQILYKKITAFDGSNGAVIKQNYFTTVGAAVYEMQFSPNVSTNSDFAYFYIHEANLVKRYSENGVVDTVWYSQHGSWVGLNNQTGFGPDISGDDLPDIYSPVNADIVLFSSAPTASLPTGDATFTPTGCGNPRGVVWEVKQSGLKGTIFMIY